jgi:hypothetical protein
MWDFALVGVLTGRRLCVGTHPLKQQFLSITLAERLKRALASLHTHNSQFDLLDSCSAAFLPRVFAVNEFLRTRRRSIRVR